MHAKFPETTWPIWLSGAFMALALVCMCRFSRWCYWLAIPVALLSTYNGWSTLIHNVSFRDAMLEQLGQAYFTQYASSFALPVVALSVYAVYDFRFRKNRMDEPFAPPNGGPAAPVANPGSTEGPSSVS